MFNFKSNKIYFFLNLIMLSALSKIAYGQLPQCSTNSELIYYTSGFNLYNYNPSLPNSATNPVSNSIALQTGSQGLAFGDNLNNSTAPSPTFYVVIGGIYHYYDGTTWVSTGHSSGPGPNFVNPGAGGGYIYNIALEGTVSRYDGTGNATIVLTLPGYTYSDGPLDVHADCAGNFYLLRTKFPNPWLRKYNPNGTLMQEWTLINPGASGGGLAIINNVVYYNTQGNMNYGTVNPLNSTITINTMPINFPAGDFAACNAGTARSATLNRKICKGETYNFYGRTLSVPGTYDTLIRTNNGCDSLMRLNLSFFPKPEVQLNVTDTIKLCSGDSTRLSVRTTVGDVTFQWYHDASILLGATDSVLIIKDPGNYNVVISDANGCKDTSSSATLMLLENVNVKIQILSSKKICAMDTVFLKANSSMTDINFIWEPYSLVKPYNMNDLSKVYAVMPESGFISVAVKNNSNCSAKDSVYIPVQYCCDASLPTAFTPNGDGKNDYFKPVMDIGQKVILFTVYNRYGQMVYESRTPNPQGWDGTFKGVPAQQDVYMWHMKYECSDRKIYQKKGDVTLVR